MPYSTLIVGGINLLPPIPSCFLGLAQQGLATTVKFTPKYVNTPATAAISSSPRLALTEWPPSCLQSLSDALRSVTAEVAVAATLSGAEQATLISRAVASESRGTVAARTIAELERVRNWFHNNLDR